MSTSRTQIRSMVRKIRGAPDYRGQPIMFNEDDHFEFDRADNNFMAAVGEGASWGLFDYRLRGRARNAAFRACPWTGASTRRASAPSSTSSPR